MFVGKISNVGGGGGPSIILNLRKQDLNFVFDIKVQCNFLKNIVNNLSIIDRNFFFYKVVGLYDHRTYFKVKNIYLNFMSIWFP